MPDSAPPPLGQSDSERTEYVVVRDDGTPVPTIGVGGPTSDIAYARLTLKNRKEQGQRAPYRIQRRTVTVGPWEDFDA